MVVALRKWLNLTRTAFGRFPPDARYNVDQSPFNLDNMPHCCYIKKGAVAQMTSMTGSGKRFGTLQICLHAGKGPQPKLGMFFKGAGRVKAASVWNFVCV